MICELLVDRVNDGLTSKLAIDQSMLSLVSVHATQCGVHKSVEDSLAVLYQSR